MAISAGDLRTLAFLNSGYASIRLAHGAQDHLDYAREAARLADESGEIALRRVVRVALARSLLFAGHLSEGLACTEEALDRLAQDQTLGIDFLGYNPYTLLATARADLLIMLGRVAEGVQWFERAIQRAREDHDILMLGVACADFGGMYSDVGDPQVALAHARQGVQFGEEAGGPETRAFAYGQLGRAYLRLGLYAEGVTSLERSREIVRESHVGFEVEPFATAYLAEAYAYSGESDRALRTVEEAVARARQRSSALLSVAQLELARVLLRTNGLGSRGAIEAALEEASQLSRQMEFHELEPLLCVERAELARLAHDEMTRQRELREAHRLLAEIGAPIRAAEVAKELGLPNASEVRQKPLCGGLKKAQRFLDPGDFA